MSDIAGPPIPKPVSAASHGTDRLARSSKDPNQTPRQATDDSGENKSKSEQREHVQVRDPAVSISASAAHLKVDEQLKEQVREIDSEGRPIIVTETATFALRPDAGLRPGDDVILQVKETGKQVAADLLRHNQRIIDPPIRLSLIVIAVHAPTGSSAEGLPDAPPTDKLEGAYRPSMSQSASAVSTARAPKLPTETEALAKVMARSTTSFEVNPNSSGVADNPDPLVKSNSSDLATLIAAQQSTPAAPSITTRTGAPSVPQAASPPPGSPQVSTPQTSAAIFSAQQTSQAQGPTDAPVNPFAPLATSTHIIQPSPLTEPVSASTTKLAQPVQAATSAPASSPGISMATTAIPGQTASPTAAQMATAAQAPGTTSAAGLGPPITAVSIAGIQAQIQLMDPSISQVTPAEVAEVRSVQPLSPGEARNLPFSAQVLGNEALARVETNQGTFVLPQKAADTLAGEMIRVSQIETAPKEAIAAASEPKAQVPSFGARLTSPGTQGGRQVQIQFAPPSQQAAMAANTGQSHILTTVDAVHTLRAFLTGDGPKSDLKIDTPFGTLTTTLAAAARPSIGDTVVILPTKIASTAPILSAGADAAATATIGASSWPSFEQAYALVQSGVPAAATALNARSAQGGPKLLNSMMFLMAALKGGNPSSWLGAKAEQAIGSQNSGLLNMLKDELGRLFNAGTETASEWRSMLLPFDTRAPDMPMLAALFSQQNTVDPDGEHDGGGTPDNGEKDQRFIIEVQFSMLGPIQLDGLVRSNRFDLTLWSNKTLPGALIQDTGDLFAAALAANGFNGALRFRESDTFPVDVEAILQKQLAA